MKPVFVVAVYAARYTFLGPANADKKVMAKLTVMVSPFVLTDVPAPDRVHWLLESEEDEPGVSGPRRHLSH
jgi:hypothetical protein